MGAAPAFVIKRGTPAFMMGDGIENAPALVIKGDMPLEIRVYFACIIRGAQ
jgi:hypothetical protein